MTIIPKLHRPIFDGLETDEEKLKVAMAEYNALKDADQDGLDFSNKTSMWIAYERQVESQREDRLFHDPLAQHFSEPYGKRLSDAMSLGMAGGIFDPPGANIGLGLEGHVLYTAARTQLINDRVGQWLEEHSGQVVNLGAGLDTRVYWLDSLKKATAYWEIDAASVMNHKQKILDRLQEKGELPKALCPRKAISMDFSKESIADLPERHKYPSITTCATCWILEGLIMYLKRPDVEQLMDHLSELSASESFLILNFSTNVPGGPSIDEIDEWLQSKGWNKEERLMFGEKGFNFGRYPDDKPANKICGFAMYWKL